MPENFRRRETLKTVLKRHRQASRLLAESSQAEWRQVVGSGYESEKYQQLAATTAELARLLAPKISDSKFWMEPLTLIEIERLRSETRDMRPPRSHDTDDEEEVIIVESDSDKQPETTEKGVSTLASMTDRRKTTSSSTNTRRKEAVTETIEVSLQWLADSDGTYEDLQYDGENPFQARGMLTNATPPEKVEKPLPPDAVRACHHALTVLMDELDILDYGSEENTEHPDPI